MFPPFDIKTKAFTLTEVLVSMMLSGMLTAFVYWSYLTVQHYYVTLVSRQEELLNEQTQQFIIRQDVYEATWIVQMPDGFRCIRNGKKEIGYVSIGNKLLRMLPNRSDTLFMECVMMTTKLQMDSVETNLVDRISIVRTKSQDTLSLSKSYSIAALFAATPAYISLRKK